MRRDPNRLPQVLAAARARLRYRRQPARRNQAGFTLLEVIVAFTIAALGLSLMYQGIAGGLASSTGAARIQMAVSLARSHLAAIGHGEAVTPQTTSGVDGDGYNWSLNVRPLATRQLSLSDSDRANDTKPTAAILYDIAVTETWTDGRHKRGVTLHTRRLDTRTAAGE